MEVGCVELSGSPAVVSGMAKFYRSPGQFEKKVREIKAALQNRSGGA
jgi:hypothetical protein